ncbi:unnamed protein product [Haemonchus placei]|uniref:G_PROTEIN_RECEP_F1_2 domain-containing protein n=1 Tax=Haemonchus placei TaxID=6290 RepID=A0A0N4WDR2_HAEPC|nr:unnamed protein product [Haemonchus placei]
MQRRVRSNSSSKIPFIQLIRFLMTDERSCSAYSYLSFILRSPNTVRSMKVMLTNICTMQILTALTAAFLQGRSIVSGSSIAILSKGPLRMFGPAAGLIAFNIIAALTFYIEAELLLSFAMIAIWPILLLVGPVSSVSNSLLPLPELSIFRYGEFGGFEPKSLNRTICICIGTAVAIISPILILYLRRLILKTFNDSNHQYSKKTIQSSKMYLKALTMQAMLPILNFVPVSFLAALAWASGSETPVSEYLRICIPTLPCVIDPLIALNFVPPYRALVLKKLRKRSTPIKAESKNSESIIPNHSPRVSVITAVE